MPRLIFIVMVTMMWFAVACASETSDIKVQSSAAANINFDEFKTYAWEVAVGELYDPKGRWAPKNMDVAAEITWLLDRELKKRGLIEVKQNPDLLVAYVITVDMESLKVIKSRKFGRLQVENVPQGTLLVEVLDRITGKVVWLAGAESDVFPNLDREMVKKRLDYAVSEMFDDFPR